MCMIRIYMNNEYIEGKKVLYQDAVSNIKDSTFTNDGIHRIEVQTTLISKKNNSISPYTKNDS